MRQLLGFGIMFGMLAGIGGMFMGMGALQYNMINWMMQMWPGPPLPFPNFGIIPFIIGIVFLVIGLVGIGTIVIIFVMVARAE